MKCRHRCQKKTKLSCWAISGRCVWTCSTKTSPLRTPRRRTRQARKAEGDERVSESRSFSWNSEDLVHAFLFFVFICYISLYIFIYTSIHVYIYIPIYIYIYTYIYCIYNDINNSMILNYYKYNVYIYIYMYMYICTCICSCMCILCICTCICICICFCICICISTYYYI